MELINQKIWESNILAFLADCKMNRKITSNRTIETYKHILRCEEPTTGKGKRRTLPHLFKFLTDNNIGNPGLKDLLLWVEAMEQSGAAVSTINLHIIVSNMFFRFLNDSIYRNDCYKLKVLPLEKSNTKSHKRKHIKPEWFLEIIKRIDIEVISGKRDKAILYTLYLSGLRRKELCNLKNSDFKIINDGFFFEILRKGRTEKELIAITKQTAIAIMEYQNALQDLGQYKHENYLFLSHSNFQSFEQLSPTSISNLVKKNYLKKLRDEHIISADEYERLCAHSLRHGFAINQTKAGVSLKILADRLGHSSLNGTMVYLRDIEEESIWESLEKDFSNITEKLNRIGEKGKQESNFT